MIRKATFVWMLLGLGCAGSSKYMVRDETPEPATPPEGKALIVFLRPGGYASGITFTVIDENGEFVGQTPAKGHVLHVTDPGKHRYLVWAENTAVLEAEVAAGKVYFVRVAPRMGAWTARGHLLALKPGGPDWDQVDEWLRDTTQWDVRPDLVERWKRDKAEGVPEQLERAHEMWAKYDAEEREERTLRVADGR